MNPHDKMIGRITHHGFPHGDVDDTKIRTRRKVKRRERFEVRREIREMQAA